MKKTVTVVEEKNKKKDKIVYFKSLNIAAGTKQKTNEKKIYIAEC